MCARLSEHIMEALIHGSPTKEAVLQELNLAEDLVNTYADRARRYWKAWGPVGEQMMAATDAWADMQLLHLQWLREAVQATYWPGPRSR
jgi:hypothetical protein